MNTTERDFSAHEILDTAGKLLGIRGVDYDSEGGERSGARIAAAFNAIKGKKILEAGDVYLIHDLTKKVRQESAAGYHIDSGDDATAYAALTAEAKAEDGRREKHGMPSLADVAVRGGFYDVKPPSSDENKQSTIHSVAHFVHGEPTVIQWGTFDELASNCKQEILLAHIDLIREKIKSKEYETNGQAKNETIQHLHKIINVVAEAGDK